MNNDVTKRRIGLILPSVNIRMEPELNRCKELLEFNFYSTRVMLDNTTEETLKAMESDLQRAAQMIATVFPEAVIYGCTSGSFIQGNDGNSNIVNIIGKYCKCPIITASWAMINSIKSLGAKKITLVTPYTDDINEAEKVFFESNGISIAAMRGLKIIPAEKLRTQSVEAIEDLVLKTDTSDSEAVFISCTNVEGFHICEKLEKKIKKPVISSNIACLWALLKAIPNEIKIINRGTLLRDYL